MSHLPAPTRRLLVPVLLSLLAAAVHAQGRGGFGVKGQLARAADLDRSGDVTAEERKAFLDGLKEDEKMGIDRRLLLAQVMLPSLDRNRDGKLRVDDLEASFAARDQNGDGALQKSENGSARRGGFMNTVMLHAADANGDGSVDAEEWKAFLAPFRDKDIGPDTVKTWIGNAKSMPASSDRNALTPGVMLATYDAGLDANFDGSVRRDDLTQLLNSLDANRDGALAADEMRPRRGAGRGGAGRGGTGRGGAGRGGGRGGGRRGPPIDRTLAPLVPWQRNLDDALALVEKTGKPLLICVNMDGESASDQLAYGRYRDKEFAKLASGFIPLVVSPDRRNPIDHDDRGRRIVEKRFGRIVDSEHIDQEPELFTRYFQGRRVAPRHVGVAPDGKILFDIFLTNDLTVIDEALKTHGKHDGKPTALGEATAKRLMNSPDAGDRDRLAAMFLQAGAADRAKLAGDALSSKRKTQHPELLRLGLCDPEASVRAAASRNACAHFASIPSALLDRVIFEAADDPVAMDSLVRSMHALASGEGEDAAKAGYAYTSRVLSGLQASSRLVDVRRWRALLAGADEVADSPPTPAELSALDARLNELDKMLREKPEDRGLRLAQAALTLRYARLRILQGADPTFLLQDVISSAKRATSAAAPNGLALAHIAVAANLLTQPDTLDWAARALLALSDEPDRARSPIAAEVLGLFAQSRTRDLYAAMNKSAEWPATWIADICSAYDVLLAHPACKVEQAVAYANFTSVLKAWSRHGVVLDAALARFPGSNELHALYRGFGLLFRGADGLQASYAKLLETTSARPAMLWYAGLATFMAGDRQIQSRQPKAAIATYARSIAQFTESKTADPRFADSADHYICLAYSSTARVQMDQDDLEAATEAMIAAFGARRASANSKDGQGKTPNENADVLRSTLERKGKAGLASRLAAARQL